MRGEENKENGDGFIFSLSFTSVFLFRKNRTVSHPNFMTWASFHSLGINL